MRVGVLWYGRRRHDARGAACSWAGCSLAVVNDDSLGEQSQRAALRMHVL